MYVFLLWPTLAKPKNSNRTLTAPPIKHHHKSLKGTIDTDTCILTTQIEIFWLV